MNEDRTNKIIELMNERNYEQLIISDPVTIYYLTGLWFDPGERLLTLIVKRNNKNTLVINKLFPVEKDLGIEVAFVDDTDDGVKKVLEYIDTDKVIGIDKNWPSHFLLRLLELVPDAKLKNGSLITDDVRAIKMPDEQELMRKSQVDNEEAIDYLKSLIPEELTELEMTEKLAQKYKELGDQGYSFDPIVAYGANSADPHHSTDNSKVKPGDEIVIDIGGVRNYYSSDMTRTFFYKEVSDKKRDVYETVREAKRRAISLIKPGVKFSELDAAARDYITEKGYGEYFTHRLGHFIGIEDHETGDVSSANDNVAKPGMVFSIEPGVYIPGEVGVRIEDLVICTEDGYENLNKYPDNLQIIM